jgi:hypothetical protein
LLDTLCTLLALSRRELLVLVAAFILSLPAVTPRIYASDEIQYFSYLRSLSFDRDVSFENEYRYFYDRKIGRGEGFHATFLELSTDAGRRPSFATIGCAILWAPFYGIGHVVAMARSYPADGFSYPYVAAVAYGSAFYGFAAVLLSIAAARRTLGTGLLPGLIIWLGTPLVFYMYVSPPYSHACSAFAVAVFVTVWLHVRTQWTVSGAAALGLAGALMAMVREQDMFLALGPAVDFGLTAIVGGAALPRDSATRNISSAQPALTHVHVAFIAASGCLSFAIGFVPQLLAYKALNGHYGPSSLVVRKMHWESPHALQVLGSPQHGFFVWTPLAAIALAGLVILAIRGPIGARRIGACALLMVALQIYVSGSVESWTVAGAFGQRRFVALTILLTMGLSAVLTAIPRRAWRFPIGVAIGLCVWWNVALMAEFGTGLMNRQRLEPRQNAYDAFVTLPRMLPDLAYRYLTDRGSFYSRKD